MKRAIRIPFGKKRKRLICSCCTGLKTENGIRGDLTLEPYYSSRPVLIEELTAAAENMCQNCELVLDAITTWMDGLAQDRNLRFEFTVTFDGLQIKPVGELFNSGSMQVVRPADRPRDFRLTPSDEAWNVKEIRQLSGNTSSDTTFHLIANWIKNCEQQHEYCKRPSTNGFPKRILEIAEESIYLRDHLDISANYACVSHCWGPDGPSIKLTNATMSCLRRGCAVSELPKTFRDAVEACQHLELSYLWIDALCILQDSAEDWEEAANTMSHIYENAYITLAATSARNSQDGLFSSDRIVKCLSRRSEVHVRELPPRFPLSVERLANSNEDSWPLLRRAWVYQERRLSRRTVHFTKYQVYWECRHEFTSEDGNERGPLKDIQISQSRSQAEDPIVCWQETIREYSGLQLTYEKDRLPAIAAIAEQTSHLRKSDDVYIAGMWQNSILSDIWWFCMSGKLQSRSQRTTPSWSWASTQGSRIEWTPRPHNAVKLLSLDYDIIGRAYLGEIIRGRIVLKGHILPMTGTDGLCEADLRDIHQSSLTRRTLMEKALTSVLRDFGLYMTQMSFCQDYGFETASPPFDIGTDLRMIVTKSDKISIAGLVLRRLCQASDEYERIGLLHSHVCLLSEAGSKSIVKKSKRLLHRVSRKRDWKHWDRELRLRESTIDAMVQSLPMEKVTIV